MNFHEAMGSAFDDLKRYEACPAHRWRKPSHEMWRAYGKQETAYATRCTRCGLRASRPTLAELQAEVIDRKV